MKTKISSKIAAFTGLLAFSSMVVAVDFIDTIEDASYLEYQQATALKMDTDISGDPKAQFELAIIFHSGAKGYVDIEQAQIMYNLAAENGYRPAQKYLAVAYNEGEFGFDKNPQLAKYWSALHTNNASPY